MKPSLYIAIGLLAITRFIFAQMESGPSSDIAPAPPDINLIKSPPPYARWDIKFEYKTPALARGTPETPPHFRERRVMLVECTKTNDTCRFVATYQDGSQMVAYVVGNIQLVAYPEHKGIVYVKIADSLWCNSMDIISSKYYPYFDWITKSSYIGTADVSDVKCYVFQRRPDGAQPRIERKAYVAANNLQPIAFQTGNIVGRYVQHDPPSVPIRLPESFQKTLDEYNRPNF